MTEPIILPDQLIANKIHFIRNQKVMLDKDLAELFDVKATRLREQVKRNLSRFPTHFMFQLSEDEANFMVSQNAIPSRQYYGGSLPYVFTEYGVLQLSNTLRSEKAREMSIRIIEIFIKMREILLTNKNLPLELEQLKQKVNGQDERMDLMYDYLMEFRKETARGSDAVKKTMRKSIGYKSSPEHSQ